jgi:hypothetical protein
MGTQADVYINDPDTRSRIKPSNRISEDGGTEIVTIPVGTKIGGTDQECVEVIFFAAGAGPTYFTIDAALGDAANTDFPMIQNKEYRLALSNVNLLRFLGVNTEKVNIIFRT